MELKRFLNSVFARETETSLSRREALAGLGLVGAVLATPTLIASRPAEAKPLDKAAEAESSKAHSEPNDEAKRQVAEAQDVSDANELTSRRHWHHHHHWHRRHWGWRRRHWGWRRRHWGWRRRHWHRRYW